MRTIIVGAAGHQGRQYLNSLTPPIEIVALVDAVAIDAPARHRNVPKYRTIAEASFATRADCALIAVPHDLHVALAQQAFQHDLHVIKEKPLSATTLERDALVAAAAGARRALLTVAQRAYRGPFQAAIDQIEEIGEPYDFRYDYCTSRRTVTTGWRATPAIAGGGVLLDMGYHALDILYRLFGHPTVTQATFSYCFEQTAECRLEDVANSLLTYASGLTGAMHISRHSRRKMERLEVYGTLGSICVTPNSFYRYDFDGSLRSSVIDRRADAKVLAQMMNHYVANMNNEVFLADNLLRHSSIVETIEALYTSRVSADR